MHHNCVVLVIIWARGWDEPSLTLLFLSLSLYNNLTDLFIQEIGKSLFQLYQIYGISEQSQSLAVHNFGSQGNGVVACQ